MTKWKTINKYINIPYPVFAGLCAFVLFFLIFAVPTFGDFSPDSNYVNFKDAAELKKYMQWHPNRTPLVSAHRGGPMKGFPENALQTFDNTMKFGPCLIECDVRMTKDGIPVLIHDRTLERTTTGNGNVKDKTLAELNKLFLKDQSGRITHYKIPTLDDTLKWAKGRAILTLDVKPNVPYKKIIQLIRKHKVEGHIIIIAYSIENVKTIHRLAPDLMISGNARGKKTVEKLLGSGVPMENLCAFVGVSEPAREIYNIIHKKGIRTILGTMHNLDNRAAVRGISVYRKLFQNGADILSTDNVPLAMKAIKDLKNIPPSKQN